MKLHTVRVREFKSIWDSNPFEIDRLACLVGKNEAGKTAVLQALYRLNPLVEADGDFEVTDDYPRSEVENYQQDVESGRRSEAVVIEATFRLEAPELQAISDEFGKDVLTKPEVVVSKGYARNASGECALFIEVPVDESVLVKNLVSEFELPEGEAAAALRAPSLKELVEHLTNAANTQNAAAAAAQTAASQLEDEAERAAALQKRKSLEQSEQAKALSARLTELTKYSSVGIGIWERFLRSRFPKFLYFDEYYQMQGHDNVQALRKRQAANTLLPSDHPLLGLIELARLDLEKLLATSRTLELKNNLQGASNFLSAQILKYWSQNKHLRMNFDVRQGLADDPEGMRQGLNIWGEVFDSRHLVSTGLGTRSAGFVWFFSFLAWYSAVKKRNESLVLLLDEPGLSLHGRAQEDLLRYFEAEIVTNPKHQLLYTTHSPFMVDSQHFDRVRIVQDKSIDSEDELPRNDDGTKVFTDVLEAGPDSLFPLQGALGYEIYQTLFVGPNSLVVEGVSDLLYIQTVSGVLAMSGRIGLDSRWTITPVGGSDKVPTFVALLGSQKNLNVATLIDFQTGDRQVIENLYKSKILKKSHVMTFTDFTGTTEADIEDLFDESFYLDLVNNAYSLSLETPIKPNDLGSRAPRILVRLGDYFAGHPLKKAVKFNHYRPAHFFAGSVSRLVIPDGTLDRFEAAFKAANALLSS